MDVGHGHISLYSTWEASCPVCDLFFSRLLNGTFFAHTHTPTSLPHNLISTTLQHTQMGFAHAYCL